MIPSPLPMSGTINLAYTASGMFFTDVYYGPEPELTTSTVLSGGSNVFSSIEFQSGASYSGGSILVGSKSPSGVLQSFDLGVRTVLGAYTYPQDLVLDNVEDFS